MEEKNKSSNASKDYMVGEPAQAQEAQTSVENECSVYELSLRADISKLDKGQTALTEQVLSIGKRLDKIDVRIDKLEDKVDAGFNKVDAKFDKVDAKFNKVDAKFDARFDKLDARIDRLYWVMLGGMLAMTSLLIAFMTFFKV